MLDINSGVDQGSASPDQFLLLNGTERSFFKNQKRSDRTVRLGQLLERNGVVLGRVQLDGDLGLKLAGHGACCETRGREEGQVWKCVSFKSVDVLGELGFPPKDTAMPTLLLFDL